MATPDIRLEELAEKIISAKKQHKSGRLFTVSISGIDASGKGYITNMLQYKLEEKGLKVANINIDPWQNPIKVRLQKENEAENIYQNIFRWNDFFEQLIRPLQKINSIYLETQGIRTDADVYYPLVYNYINIDILLIEGILLFKKKYLSLYDYKIWVDCPFETALNRAIKRNVEKLDEKALIHDYETFYHAAQLLHFEKDRPQKTADIVFDNT